MSSKETAQYQIAFQFQFQQDISNQPLEIDILDSNVFVISAQQKSQLAPYLGSATPPMNNASVWSTGLYLNIASASAYGGVENILWSTFEGGSLRLNLNTNGALIGAYYAVLGGTGGGGKLQPGENIISINNSR